MTLFQSIELCFENTIYLRVLLLVGYNFTNISLEQKHQKTVPPANYLKIEPSLPKTKVKQILAKEKEVLGNKSLSLILIKPTNYCGFVKMISRSDFEKTKMIKKLQQ